MNGIASLFAPLVLLLSSGNAQAPETQLLPPPEDNPEIASEPGQMRGWIALEAVRDVPIFAQVRIEQRVIVRIAPSAAARHSMMADLPQREIETRFEERKMGKCINLRSIAGVQANEGTRLLLFLRDRRIVSAHLEKACRARDFYSGFYVEKDNDGNICIERDKLMSRAGAKCEIARLRELVAVRD